MQGGELPWLTCQEIVGQVLGGKGEGDAGRQQEGGDIHAQHGQHDDAGSQKGRALAGGDDGAGDAAVDGALPPQVHAGGLHHAVGKPEHPHEHDQQADAGEHEGRVGPDGAQQHAGTQQQRGQHWQRHLHRTPGVPSK